MGVRRREEQAIAVGDKPATCRFSVAIGYAVHVAAVGAHNELLVALHAGERGLHGDPLTILAPIGLRILPTKGELTDVCEMTLSLLGRDASVARLCKTRLGPERNRRPEDGEGGGDGYLSDQHR